MSDGTDNSDWKTDPMSALVKVAGIVLVNATRAHTTGDRNGESMARLILKQIEDLQGEMGGN